MIRAYFSDLYDEFRNKHLNEEMRVPGLTNIDIVQEKLDKEGLLWRDFDSESKEKRLNRLQIFANVDLEDCIVPDNASMIDQSIHNLR